MCSTEQMVNSLTVVCYLVHVMTLPFSCIERSSIGLSLSFKSIGLVFSFNYVFTD